MVLLNRIYYLVTFLLYYIKEVLVSNFYIAIDILKPTLRMTPEIVEVKVDTRNENEILALSNLISMTPGTLVVEYSEETGIMKVHTMYYDDPEDFERKMEGIKKRIARIF